MAHTHDEKTENGKREEEGDRDKLKSKCNELNGTRY